MIFLNESYPAVPTVHLASPTTARPCFGANFRQARHYMFPAVMRYFPLRHVSNGGRPLHLAVIWVFNQKCAKNHVDRRERQAAC